MKKILRKSNLILFIPLFILMIFSFFCMYQAQFVKSIYALHLKKQILWYFIGFILILLFQKLKIRFFFEHSFFLYLIGNILLILVLFFGKEVNASRAWFDLKFFNFQPSEFVKITLLLYLVHLSDLFHNKIFSEFKFILIAIIATLIPSILVFLEPDTGAIIIYLLILFSIFLLSGIKKIWFILAFGLAFVLLGGFFYLYFCNQDLLIKWIGTSFFYRVDRLLNFKKGSGMQLNNALVTIGNASFLGHGIQNNLLYVPEFPTDFVFTLNTAIFGFLGDIIVLFCFLLLNLFFINKIFKEKKYHYKLFINGFLFIFIYQQIQNILMNLGLFPIMGIPLPFLSYGGSNMIIYFIFLGFILNMTKRKNI